MIAKPTINSPLTCRYCHLPVYWDDDANSGEGDYCSTIPFRKKGGYHVFYECHVNYNHDPVSFKNYLDLCK